MVRILFLLLSMMSSVAFAQTGEKPKSAKFFEYGKITDNLLKEKLNEFKQTLLPDAQGYIFNYGTDKEIARREKQLQRNYPRCDYDCPRMTIVRGGNVGKPRTVIWIVPPGTENPTP